MEDFISCQQEKQVTEALSAAETWQRRHSQEVEEKNKVEIQVSLLNR